MIRMEIPEGFTLQRRFLHAAAVSRPQIERRMAHFAALVETRVKAKASGRPGPRAITGDYRRTITRERVIGLGFTGWLIGTNAPQGRRLEFGFVGADALGRIYNQPPYPHFGPALDELEPEIEAGLDGIVDGLVRVVVA